MCPTATWSRSRRIMADWRCAVAGLLTNWSVWPIRAMAGSEKLRGDRGRAHDPGQDQPRAAPVYRQHTRRRAHPRPCRARSLGNRKSPPLMSGRRLERRPDGRTDERTGEKCRRQPRHHPPPRAQSVAPRSLPQGRHSNSPHPRRFLRFLPLPPAGAPSSLMRLPCDLSRDEFADVFSIHS